VALFLLYAVTASFGLALDGQSRGAVISVAAQTPVATGPTVTNDLTVISRKISLDSTLQSQGRVRVGNRLLQNELVALRTSYLTIVRATRDQEGFTRALFWLA
jgi:hypothetical protein